MGLVERLNSTSALPKEQLALSQQTIMNMLIPTTKEANFEDINLTHSSDFLHQKSLEGYEWKYKSLETAAAQLTKAAKKIWQKDNYKAAKKSITLKSGRTAQTYVFPIEYAQQALKIMEQKGKIYKK